MLWKPQDILKVDNYCEPIIDIDTWNGAEESGVMTYPAKKSDGLIAVTSFGGETAGIGYDLHYDGDPVAGKVTFDADMNPTFTPTVGL